MVYHRIQDYKKSKELYWRTVKEYDNYAGPSDEVALASLNKLSLFIAEEYENEGNKVIAEKIKENAANAKKLLEVLDSIPGQEHSK